MSDPLASFRLPPPARAPGVFVVAATSKQANKWIETARLKDDPRVLLKPGDLSDVEFQSKDVLVWVAGWDRNLDRFALTDAIERSVVAGDMPRETHEAAA